MIHKTIKNELTNAMREKDEVKKSALRSVLTAITNEAVAQKKKPDELLDDDTVLSVITRQVKQRKDSIAQFQTGKRDDLAKEEAAELSYIEPFMPAQLSDEEVNKIIQDKKESLGISDISQIGKLIGIVMSEIKGRASGAHIKKLIEKTFE